LLDKKRASIEETYKKNYGLFSVWKAAVLKCPLPLKFLAERRKEYGDKSSASTSSSSKIDFEMKIAQFSLESPTISQLLNDDWASWLRHNIKRGSRDLASALFDAHPNSVDLLSALQVAWERDGGCVDGSEAVKDLRARKESMSTENPLRRKKYRVEPNRHATFFGYLNDDFIGGETVFPRAIPPQGARQLIVRANGTLVASQRPEERPGMSECAAGLRVEPKKGTAALFYSKSGAGVNDYMSYHGGCPPVQGVKYGLNGFMWNLHAETGYHAWSHIMN